MVLAEYEEVLKQLDKWASEARAVSRAQPDLDSKMEMLRFHDTLREVGAKLRLHYFQAEDASKYDFLTEEESVLVAHLRED